DEQFAAVQQEPPRAVEIAGPEPGLVGGREVLARIEKRAPRPPRPRGSQARGAEPCHGMPEDAERDVGVGWAQVKTEENGRARGLRQLLLTGDGDVAPEVFRMSHAEERRTRDPAPAKPGDRGGQAQVTATRLLRGPRRDGAATAPARETDGGEQRRQGVF